MSGRAKTDMDIKRPVFHHVLLKTTRLKEMIDWYAAVIGSETVFQNPGIAFLSNDNANHRISLLSSPLLTDDPDFQRHTGMHHLAFEYASVDDLLATWTRLRSDFGYEPHMSLHHGPTLSFYYVDPDGNSVELQVDAFGHWALSKAFIRDSLQFRADPIGKFVDPAKMVAARAAGIAGDELLRRAYAGEYPASIPPNLRVALPPP
jgi:catechol 2,3-dioxygenase